MVETASKMLALQMKAADFRLLDTGSNQYVSLQELKSPVATVIMFLCNHCPYVKHIQHKLVEIAKAYQAKNISFIAISSNDAQHYPQDSPDKMREEAQRNHYTFPYLYDESQEVAKAYQAACTPDFFIFDKDLRSVYRGRFDASTPGNGLEVTGRDLSEALDQLIAGQPLNVDQKASVGCNIKWRK
jgi:peroxiredoxin